MAHGVFGTAINCIDGRVQVPLYTWMAGKFHLDYVDMINEPGPDRIMSDGSVNEIESVKKKVLISVTGHHSKILVIAGHYDCAGNPVTEDEHKRQIKIAVDLIKTWALPVEIIQGVYLNEKWQVEVVA